MEQSKSISDMTDDELIARSVALEDNQRSAYGSELSSEHCNSINERLAVVGEELARRGLTQLEVSKRASRLGLFANLPD